jgi:SAM-dependent methyltransferase
MLCCDHVLRQEPMNMTEDFDVPTDWYEHFFTAPVNSFWERVAPQVGDTDLNFLLRHMACSPPARVLDLACGSGRHALGLAAKGFKVTGLDTSKDAIERASAAAADLPVDFYLADMRNFSADVPFNAAICLGNSIAYFDPFELAALLTHLSTKLGTGARLIIETYSCAESVFPLQMESEVAFAGGTYHSRYSYDVRTSRLKTAAELKMDGAVHHLLYAHYVMTAGALVAALERAGFAVLSLYSDTDDGRFGPGSKKLLLVSERQV